MSKPEQNRGLFSGPEGESLFSTPLMKFFRHNPLPELFRKVDGLEDDRLLAIVTALIVEDRIDAALRSFLPRYTRLTEKSEFTFSLKIALLEGLGMIPSKLLNAATLVRKIRNEFAHDLEIQSFTQLEQKLLNQLKTLRSNVYGDVADTERRPKATLAEEYKALAFFCITGLDAYRANLAYLYAHIFNNSFISSLLAKCAGENKAELEAVLAQIPLSVEIVDGNRIEKYQKGVVNIIAGESGGTVDLGKILK